MRTLDEKPRVLLLSGGVGGARLARGFSRLEEWDTTVVVNTGDDDWVYGVYVAPDLDTVVYTLAEEEGPQGWGMAGETWQVMESLSGFPIDTTFRLGDRDLATNLFRTMRIGEGKPLSLITGEIAAAFKLGIRVLPATDQPVRTKLRTVGGEWLDFQDYFVVRQHRDRITRIQYDGAEDARPAPGVIEAIGRARAVIIAPSNPPLSIWPILAVPGIRSALEAADTVIAVSPLFGGKALKGPAADVMDSLGLPPGNRGVAEAYRNLLSGLVVDNGDAEDVGFLSDMGLGAWATDTRIADPAASARLAAEIMAAL